MRDKLFDTIKKEWVFYLIILVSVIFFFTPYYAPGFTHGAETDFHYVRVMTLADSLKVGIFPAKIRPTHMRLFGYGIGFFYPDLFIYLPAALIALGAEYEITIKVYEFLIILIGSFVTYGCFKKLSGRSEIALVGEILFLNSHLMDNNIFEGGGMPHMFAYLFLPLAFCGLLSAFKDEKKGYLGYAVGLTIVLLTHNMIFLTMMFAMIIVVLIYAGVIAKNFKIILKLIGVSLASMALTTAYWLPAMEQVQHIKFIAFFDNAYSVTDHILDLATLITLHVSPHYFALFVICGVVDAALLIKKRKLSIDTISIFVTSALLMWLMCSKAVWTSSIGQALNFFEYTSRFEYVVVILMVMTAVLTLREAADAFGFEKVLSEKKTQLICVAVCVLLLFGTRLIIRPDFLSPSNDDRMYLTRELVDDNWIVSGAEWLPVECEPTACRAPENAPASDGSSADGFKHELGKYFEVWVDLSKEYYDMPYVYYYGYRAYLLDDNNNPTKELEVGEAFDDNGYARVFMPTDQAGVGHVMITYRKTVMQKAAYAISAISAFIILAALMISGIIGKKDKKQI